MPSLPPEPRVLVTGAGGPAAVSVLRALAPRAELFAVDIDPHAAGLYLAADGHRAIVRRGDDPDFVRDLLARCREWNVDVLIPTVDDELIPIAVAISRFAEIGTSVVVGAAAAIDTCVDKWRLVRSIGQLPAPATSLLVQWFEPTTVPSWPAIVKPRSGSGSRGVRLIESPAQLGDVPRDGSHILQEYLPGEELSVDVYVAADHRPMGAVPRERLKVDSGVAVAGRTIHDPEAIDLALAVVASVGLTGPANVQLRRDAAGRLRLLEVNPRFPGSLPLTIRAGFDIPGIALDEALGATPDAIVGFDEVAVVRHLEEVIVDVEAIEEMRSAGCPTLEVAR